MVAHRLRLALVIVDDEIGVHLRDLLDDQDVLPQSRSCDSRLIHSFVDIRNPGDTSAGRHLAPGAGVYYDLVSAPPAGRCCGGEV
jgi:hypothetical protein